MSNLPEKQVEGGIDEPTPLRRNTWDRTPKKNKSKEKIRIRVVVIVIKGDLKNAGFGRGEDEIRGNT